LDGVTGEGRLPLELKIRFLNLFAGYPKGLLRGYFHFKSITCKPDELAFESLLTIDRFSQRKSDLLSDDSLKIAWFGRLPLDARRADFKRVPFLQNPLVGVQ
jgi:hypothetical protein